MFLDQTSQDTIEEFWRSAGQDEAVPAQFERVVALALPIAVVKVPHLRLIDIEGWLQRRHIGFLFDTRTRAVRGCLVAYGGKGVVFIDACDPLNEQRLTLAHEVAHFMLDYSRPRSNAIAKLGSPVTPALDGLRPPTLDERVKAILTGVPLNLYWHLVERDSSGEAGNDIVWRIETRADKMAMALLAPPAQVLAQADLHAPAYQDRFESVLTVLSQVFDLPAPMARHYAHGLLEAVRKGPSWIESFRRR